MNKTYAVIVIGGGATGAGVARDAAMRGFTTLLVEKSTLGSGTSGSYHGLLHSGGRYAVVDPQAAQECITENMILKKIAKDAIDDTGGLFLATNDDDLSYSDRFLKACHKAGIPIEELTIARVLAEEPLINPEIKRAFRVPDAYCDSQKLIRMNIQSAKYYGAEVLTNHAVTGFVIQANKIHGVYLTDQRTGEKKTVGCRFVINAAGVWSGHIARLANIPLVVTANKGSMLVLKKRLSKNVLNRCRMPGDGDILVPKAGTCVLGTTSVSTNNLTDTTTAAWEKNRLLKEGENLIKDFASYSVLGTYAGIRPLFNSHEHSDGRMISRRFTLINHKTTDNLENMITITGGKLTTYRVMAEAAVDALCDNVKLNRPCKTAKETLPILKNHPFYAFQFQNYLHKNRMLRHLRSKFASH